MPLVSIIIPYYKKKKFIKKTLASVLNQSFKNFEIIIVYNDENLVESKFLKKLIGNKKKIKLIIKKKKLGAGNARNIGVKNSKGKYLAFLDSDDLWKKNKLKCQLKFMNNYKVDISHTSYFVIKKNKKIRIKSRSFENYKNLLASCDIGLSTVIIKKNIFIKNFGFPNIKTKEDFVLWLKILQAGHKIGYLDKTLSSWRKVENSLSSNTLQKIKDGFIVYNKFMNFNFLQSLYYLILLSFFSLKKNFKVIF